MSLFNLNAHRDSQESVKNGTLNEDNVCSKVWKEIWSKGETKTTCWCSGQSTSTPEGRNPPKSSNTGKRRWMMLAPLQTGSISSDSGGKSESWINRIYFYFWKLNAASCGPKRACTDLQCEKQRVTHSDLLASSLLSTASCATGENRCRCCTTTSGPERLSKNDVGRGEKDEFMQNIL